MKNNKVVLAYSGGLDTSYCIKYLSKEKNLEVHAVTVNTGGFSENELSSMKKKAFQLGAKSFQVIDATSDYYEKCIRYLVFGNVLRNNTYPLSVSAERMFQALEVAKSAQQIGASYIAHGSTGAGNDQVRFDLVFNVLCDEVEIITPIRDLKLSRQEEIDYLQKNGFDLSWEKAKYSINKGVWGTSVGGAETLTSNQHLPEEAFPTACTATTPLDVSLHFEKGELIGIDHEKSLFPLEAIEKLEQLAAPFAIGRDTHVGDTIIGIKGRVGFEAAAPMVIIKAHHLLEKHTLTKWQQYWKEQLANWYGMLLHEGQFLDPSMRNIETFLESTQTLVSGEVYVRFHPYRIELLGIDSPNDLMNAGFGQYGEMNNKWSGEDVRGFTKILANQVKIFYSVHQKTETL